MAYGAAGKFRLGQMTKTGKPLTSRTDSGTVYKDTDKVQPPKLEKKPIKGLSRQSDK